MHRSPSDVALFVKSITDQSSKFMSGAGLNLMVVYHPDCMIP